MINIETVGTTLFYAEVATAKQLKEAVVMLEGAGNVVMRVEPVYESVCEGDFCGLDLKAAFIHVAGAAQPLTRPGTSNAA